MKIFYKKDYHRVLVELKKKQIELLETRKDISELLAFISTMEKNIYNLQKNIHKLNGAKGGYTKQINKLNRIILENEKQANNDLKITNNKILELNKEIEELKSDRYLIKKLPTGRKPKAETMKVKSGALQSKIIEKVKQ